MYAFGKPLNEINLNDIKSLISNKTKESQLFNYDFDFEKEAKDLVDRIFQAFHFDKAPNLEG